MKRRKNHGSAHDAEDVERVVDIQVPYSYSKKQLEVDVPEHPHLATLNL